MSASSLKPTLARVASGERLSEAEAEAAFGVIMAGQATPAQIAGLVMALRVRGETPAELAGASRAMRAQMLRITAPAAAIDVCGTGGDGAGTLNISTAVTFVLAGAGVPVAKHGNRALSSRAGGADVLTALGIEVDLPIERLSAVLAEVGCVFLFAPRHHAALRHAASVRVELGVRTLFNLLGPLANPAGVRRQLIGVFAERWTRPMAETLGRLGADCAWVVHGAGTDELTLAGRNTVAAWDGAAVRTFTVLAADAGLPDAPLQAIAGGDATDNAASLLAMLRGAPGAYRDTVLLNAAAGLVIAARAADLREGAALAARAIDQGAALGALEALRRTAARS